MSDRNNVRGTPPSFHIHQQQMSYEISAAVSLASLIRKKKMINSSLSDRTNVKGTRPSFHIHQQQIS